MDPKVSELQLGARTTLGKGTHLKLVPKNGNLMTTTNTQEPTVEENKCLEVSGGNFGARLSNDFLNDQRVRNLAHRTLGIYVLLRAYFERGTPVPESSKHACAWLMTTQAAFKTAIAELTSGEAPLVVMLQGTIVPTPFGKLNKVGTKQRKVEAAIKRWTSSEDETLNQPNEVPDSPKPKRKYTRKATGQQVFTDSPALDQSEPAKAPHTQAQMSLLLDEDSDTPSSNNEIQRAPPCPYDQLHALFIEVCVSLPVIQIPARWASARRTEVARRWLEHPSIEFWDKYFRSIEASDFLCNRKGRGYRASFDWILKPANMQKITDGNFKNLGSGKRDLFNQAGGFVEGSYGEHQVDESATWMNPPKK